MDALTLVRNLIRVGQINSVNPPKGTVDVLFPDKDNYIASDLSLLNNEYNIPNVGEQVLCLFLGNGLEQGFCLGSFYSEQFRPPSTDKNIYHKQFGDGTSIEYNKETKTLNIDASGKVIIKANEILLGDGANEGIPLGNQLKTWLDNHTHEYSWTSSGGNGTTSKPSQSPNPSGTVKAK